MGFRQYDDANTKAKTLTTDNSKLSGDKLAKEDDIKKLKECIGVPPTETVDGVANNIFKDDMKKYVGGYPVDSLFYRPAGEDEENDRRAKRGIERRQEGPLKSLPTSIELAWMPGNSETEEEERDKAAKDLAAENTKFQGERSRLNDEKSKLQESLQKIRTEAKGDREAVLADLDKAKALNKKLMDLLDEQAEKIKAPGGGQQIQSANGKVIHANQREGTVWINLGSADSLLRRSPLPSIPPG